MTNKILTAGSTIPSKKLFELTIGGGLVFWATTIATSLLPIAAEYRAAYSNWSIQTVWVASLPMGMIIGYCVSYFLLRYFFGMSNSFDALHYFLIGVMFNVARFLLLGIVIGYLYNERADSRFKGDRNEFNQ